VVIIIFDLSRRELRFAKRKIFQVASVILILAVILGGGKFLYDRLESSADVGSQGWESADGAVSTGLLKSSAPILQISINAEIADENSAPVFSIKSIKEKKKGYPTEQNKSDQDPYILGMLDNQGNSLDSLTFDVPRYFSQDSVQDNKLEGNTSLEKQILLSYSMLWQETAKKIQIKDLSNNILATQDLKGLAPEDNNLEFQTKPGKGKKTSQVGDKAMAASNNQSLNITFISANYSDLTVFHSDINEAISTLLTFEPFKTRSSQILFHYIDNTADLGCTTTGYFSCNSTKVIEQVIKSGVLFDKILVIGDHQAYGGTGYLDGQMAFYDNAAGPKVAVHELGHTFSLWDEYTTNGYLGLSRGIYKNCYAGEPPAQNWVEVAKRDYYLGCSSPNYYRTSENSIMNTADNKYFNIVSQNILNTKFNQYMSTFLDDKSPTAKIMAPIKNSIISNNLTITSSVKDNNNVARVELWLDSVHYTTNYLSPFTFILSSNTLSNGKHSLQIKAYDVLGNHGDSPIISVNINNSLSDFSPPQITILNNSLVVAPKASAVIQAKVTDNVGVTSVISYGEEFELKDGIYVLGEDFYYLNPGTYFVPIFAKDAVGNTTSAGFVFNISEDPSLTAYISYPYQNLNFAGGSTINIYAQAFAPTGINKVWFYVNNIGVCTDTVPPYTCNWTMPATLGKFYQIKAKAFDVAGNTAFSPVITVTGPKGY